MKKLKEKGEIERKKKKKKFNEKIKRGHSKEKEKQGKRVGADRFLLFVLSGAAFVRGRKKDRKSARKSSLRYALVKVSYDR